ncbi:glycosyl transferase family 90-domain-containing protein [Melampsora americana]|nr:glycosyl transferase family 90-domain-containing protein [Melampsora americana]
MSSFFRKWRNSSPGQSPLLSHPSSPSPHLSPANLIRSKPISWIIYLIIIYLIIQIDRQFIRTSTSSGNQICSTHHLLNAVKSKACSTLSPTSSSNSSNSSSKLNQYKSKLCEDLNEKEKESNLKESLLNEFHEKVEFNQTLSSTLLMNHHEEEDQDREDRKYELIEIEFDRSMGIKRCEKNFPNLFYELERVVKFYKESKKKVTLDQLDEAMKVGHARVLIYENRVYIKEYKGGPGKRTEALLNSIQEAVITSPELIPNIEFVVKTVDAPTGDDTKLPLWVLDRTSDQEDVWLTPDYGFYSWPEPKVGGMIEVRDKCKEVEKKVQWKDKIPKAFWRGAILVKLREQMIEISKGHEWNDIKPLVWQHLDGLLKTPEEHCQYQYLIHVEGYAYSGRLKYLQMCRSVIVSHEMKFIQHFHHLLDSNPNSPTQNIALAKGPGFEGLPELMKSLLNDPKRSELIAENSNRLFRYYLSPAGISCYWRQMFRAWSEVQGFVPTKLNNYTAFESFNLMHTVQWNPY